MARPLLDVSDVLTDPDFNDSTLQCVRSALTTGADGIGSVAQSTFQFSGVVTSDRGEVLQRLAIGERSSDSILVITRTKLLPAGNQNQTADVVVWNGIQYTVTSVNDYSKYGIGFSEASCEKIPLTNPA